MRRLLKRRSPKKPDGKSSILLPGGDGSSVDHSDFSSIPAEPPTFLCLNGEYVMDGDDLSSLHESVVEQPQGADKLAASTLELDRLLLIPEDDEESMMGESVKMDSVLKQWGRQCVSPANTLDSALASHSDVQTNATTIPSGNFKRHGSSPLLSFVYIALLMPTAAIYRDDEPSVQSNETLASQGQKLFIEQNLPLPTDVIERSIHWHLQLIVQPAENDVNIGDSKRSLPVRVDDESLLVSHDENVLHVVDGVVQLHLYQQDFAKALETYESLLRDLRRRKSNPSFITPLLCRLSSVSLLAGEQQKALNYSEEILQRSAFDTQSALVARIQLGLTYFGLSDFANALISWREAAYKVGTNLAVASLLWNNIACLQIYLGDAVSAERALNESIALRKQIQGVPSQFRKELLNTATTLSNLAILEAREQRYSEAISHLDECLLLQESVLEDGNEAILETLEHLESLANAEERVSRTKRIDSSIEADLVSEAPEFPAWRAQRIFDEGLPLPRATNGQDLLCDYVDLGSLVHQIGPYQLVRDTIMESFSCLTKSELTFVPATHATRFSIPIDVDGTEVIDADLHLPHIYTQAKEYLERNEIDDVLELLKGTLRSHRKKYGTLHPLVAATLHNLGMVMLFIEKYTAAFAYFQHAVSIRSATLGFEHPDVAISLTKMGLIQAARKDFDNAIMIFSQVLRARRKTLGYNHPEVAKTLSNLACFHYECGGLLPASKALEESIEILRNSSFTGGAPLQAALATVLCNFGFVLVKRRKFDDATRAYNEALRLRLILGEAVYASVAVTRENLAYGMAFSSLTTEQPRQDGKLVDIAKMIEPYLDNMRCT